MTDFTDFATVLAAANDDLARMKSEIKKVDTAIAQENEDRYSPVYEYFKQIAELLKTSNCVCPRAVHIDGLSFSFQLNAHKGYNSSAIEIGAAHKSGEFKVWIYFPSTYGDLQRYYKGSTLNMVNEIVDKFDDIESELTEKFKDAITTVMAKKIEDAEAEYMTKSVTLDELQNGGK